MTETNDTALSEQNESKNMETNDEGEMPLQDKPTPKPRTRTAKDDALQKQHERREAKWLNEKEKLLNELHNWKKQKDGHGEMVQELKNNNEMLEKKCEELGAGIALLLSEKEQACQIIKELQEKSTEMASQTQEYYRRSQAFQNETCTLRQNLDEKNELLNQALEQNQAYANQLNNNEQQIQSLKEELAKHEKTLAKQKEQYAEFSSITNDMEKELHENQSKVRELNKMLQSKAKENREMLEEQNEMIRQFERKNETLASHVEMLKNNAGKTQSDKDKLEGDLVAMKLENKRLVAEKEKMQEAKQNLAEERDFYTEKCKKLENGLKVNAEDEISHLQQAVEALNQENNVLRERNEKLGRDASALRSINNDLKAKSKQLNGSLGEDNGAFKSEEPLRQKKPEAMDTSNGINTSAAVGRTSRNSTPRTSHRSTPRPAGTPTGGPTTRSASSGPNDTAEKQWYETEEGGDIFSQIYSELNGNFAAIDISRELSTKNISLLVTTDERKKFEVHFPKNFPLAAVRVKYAGALKEITVPYNKNAGPSDFCKNFSKMLTEMVYEAKTQK